MTPPVTHQGLALFLAFLGGAALGNLLGALRQGRWGAVALDAVVAAGLFLCAAVFGGLL